MSSIKNIICLMILFSNYIFSNDSANQSNSQPISFNEHTNRISSIAISSDNTFFATASWDGTAILWRSSDCSVKFRLKSHEYFITSLAISKNNKFIVTTSADATAIIWDTETGEKLHVLKGHYDFITDAVISHDGTIIITSCYDKTSIIWDVATGKMLGKLDTHGKAVNKAAIDRQDNFFVTIADKFAYIWHKFGQLRHILGGHTAEITSVKISNNSKYVITGSNDKTVRIWDSENGKLIHALEGHPFFVGALEVTANDAYVISGSANNIIVWDVENGTIVYNFFDSEIGISFANYLSLATDNRFLVSGSFDGHIRIWDLLTGTLHKRIKNAESIITAIASSSNGEFIICGTEDGAIRKHSF